MKVVESIFTQSRCAFCLWLRGSLLSSRIEASYRAYSQQNSKSCITFVVEQESFTAHYTVHSCNASCHGNRVCTGSNDCICQTGYRGVDCGIAVCPNNCSNNGVCDMVRILHSYTRIVCVHLYGCVLPTKFTNCGPPIPKALRNDPN